MGGLLTVFALAMGTTPLAGQDLTLPADEGMHPDADFEMWSLLAHLEGESGSRLGVGIMFFTGRIVGLNLSGTFHLVADEGATEWTATRDLVLPIFGSSTHTRGPLDEAYDRSRLWRDSASGEITALVRTDGTEIVLTFEPTIEPVDFGSVSVGEGAAQRIYTLPSGRVKGRITLEGDDPEEVSGMAVFQHAWGDSPDPDRTGSQFSAHLDDGSALLAYHGERPGSVHVLSLARPDGAKWSPRHSMPSPSGSSASRWTELAFWWTGGCARRRRGRSPPWTCGSGRPPAVSRFGCWGCRFGSDGARCREAWRTPPFGGRATCCFGGRRLETPLVNEPSS